MVAVELILALVAWKRKWNEIALVPFIIALGVSLLLNWADRAAGGGLAAIFAGYLFLIHAAAIGTLLIMSVQRPKAAKHINKS